MRTPPRPAIPDGTLMRLLMRASGPFLPEENPAGAVYGLLAVGSLLAAESGRYETWLDTILSAVIAGSLYWLLHSYATLLGARLSSPDRIRPRALVIALSHNYAILRGTAIPVLTLIVAWALGASQATGVTDALWACVVCIVLFELIAAVRVRAGFAELMLDVGVGVTLGLAILALRVVLH
jgi:hypothetical protein